MCKDMTGTNHPLLFRLIFMLVTCALVSVPFAHRVGAAPITPQMSAFVAVGGDVADICGGTGNHLTSGCESCRIVNGSSLPPLLRVAAPVELPQCACLASGYDHPDLQTALHIFPPVRAPPHV